MYDFFFKSSKLHDAKLSSVRVINPGAFSYNTNLETVSIPAGVEMSFSIFNGCTKLKNVTIAEGMTEIGAETFRDCTSLKEIVLPSTVTTIRDRAFQDCSALVSLTCKATIAPTLAADNLGTQYYFHFLNINALCVLKHPAGSDYSTWSSKFAEVVQDL